MNRQCDQVVAITAPKLLWSIDIPWEITSKTAKTKVDGQVSTCRRMFGISMKVMDFQRSCLAFANAFIRALASTFFKVITAKFVSMRKFKTPYV